MWQSDKFESSELKKYQVYSAMNNKSMTYFESRIPINDRYKTQKHFRSEPQQYERIWNRQTSDYKSMTNGAHDCEATP